MAAPGTASGTPGDGAQPLPTPARSAIRQVATRRQGETGRVIGVSREERAGAISPAMRATCRWFAKGKGQECDKLRRRNQDERLPLSQAAASCNGSMHVDRLPHSAAPPGAAGEQVSDANAAARGAYCGARRGRRCQPPLWAWGLLAARLVLPDPRGSGNDRPALRTDCIARIAPKENGMSATVSLPPDASARLAMLAEMLERSSSKGEADNRTESSRRETSRESSAARKNS